MYVCVFVQLPSADRVLRFSIENASKRLDYPASCTSLCADRVLHFSIENASKRLDYPASCTSLLLLLSSHRKVAFCSQGVETRHNRRAIDGCRLRVRSKAYSASSDKHGVCVWFWRDCAAKVCLASVNWCIFHVNQLPSSRRPNMAWPENEFEESMPNTRTQTTSRSRTSDLGCRSWCNV